MRELNFRAWSESKKQMYYATPYRGYIKSNGSWWSIYNGDDVLVASSVNDDKLMQYTGVKDKNGVEIYEGDIVRVTLSDPIGNSLSSTHIFKNPFDYDLEEIIWIKDSNELEVLGNIFENKELLKEKL